MIKTFQFQTCSRQFPLWCMVLTASFNLPMRSMRNPPSDEEEEEEVVEEDKEEHREEVRLVRVCTSVASWNIGTNQLVLWWSLSPSLEPGSG